MTAQNPRSRPSPNPKKSTKVQLGGLLNPPEQQRSRSSPAGDCPVCQYKITQEGKPAKPKQTFFQMKKYGQELPSCLISKFISRRGPPCTAAIMSTISENGNTNNNCSRIHQFYGEELLAISKHDPLHELTVQEKDLVWKVREYCSDNLPTMLPRIIDCVDYANRVQVAELHGLLERWPLLSPEEALQLFDFYYPDEHVRSFAVRCLVRIFF